MTDHAELRRLAEEVIRIERNEDEPISAAWELFDSAANPTTILALLDEIDRLKAESDRLRQGMKGDYDIDAWLDWSKEKERIKSENEELRGALQAVVDDPTWRSNDNTLWPKIIKAMDRGATQ
ncbi:ead/Ea22-like family protein [Pseudomonas aeruginosa]